MAADCGDAEAVSTFEIEASIFSRLIPPPAGSRDAQRSAATLPLGNPLLSALSIENLFGLKKNRVHVGRPLRWDVRSFHSLGRNTTVARLLLFLKFDFNCGKIDSWVENKRMHGEKNTKCWDLGCLLLQLPRDRVLFVMVMIIQIGRFPIEENARSSIS